jgi:hypothetical protein
MVMTMPTVAARLVMVFIVYDVWMCRYICEEPPLWDSPQRGGSLRIGEAKLSR